MVVQVIVIEVEAEGCRSRSDRVTPLRTALISHMSLESTTTIKAKLALGLGPKAPRYWSLLNSFLSAAISRTEFDEQIRECVDTSPLGTPLSFPFVLQSPNHHP
jgi:hypothetical protein